MITSTEINSCLKEPVFSAHDANLIKLAKKYLAEHDTKGTHRSITFILLFDMNTIHGIQYVERKNFPATYYSKNLPKSEREQSLLFIGRVRRTPAVLSSKFWCIVIFDCGPCKFSYFVSAPQKIEFGRKSCSLFLSYRNN